MKIYVVYFWEPHEMPWGHRYFKDADTARETYEYLRKTSKARVDMDEFETED